MVFPVPAAPVKKTFLPVETKERISLCSGEELLKGGIAIRRAEDGAGRGREGEVGGVIQGDRFVFEQVVLFGGRSSASLTLLVASGGRAIGFRRGSRRSKGSVSALFALLALPWPSLQFPTSSELCGASPSPINVFSVTKLVASANV